MRGKKRKRRSTRRRDRKRINVGEGRRKNRGE
jgi:hypothetical protein